MQEVVQVTLEIDPITTRDPTPTSKTDMEGARRSGGRPRTKVMVALEESADLGPPAEIGNTLECRRNMRLRQTALFTASVENLILPRSTGEKCHSADF